MNENNNKKCLFGGELFTSVDCMINHSNCIQIQNKTSAYQKEWIEQDKLLKKL